jgi:hypothetical protein
MSAVADHPPISTAAQPVPRCKLCSCKLVVGVGDELDRRLCRDCKTRPMPGPSSNGNGHRPTAEAANAPATMAAASAPSLPPRPFGPADKAIIKSLHHLPAAQLLELLNARHIDDGCAPFTMEQLYEEWKAAEADQARSGEWASLRRVISAARRSGLLATITPQLVDDFAVVFSLSPAQHMHVRDVMRSAREIES